MIVLGIETSCDETSVAIVKDGIEVLGEITHSQIDIHRLYGGVVPEIAAREHFTSIDIAISECLKKVQESFLDFSWMNIDRIAVVNGPGLISSLLVGVTAAKTLSWTLNKEIVSVNHLNAHVCANHLVDGVMPPFVCLLASGGHTQLLLVEQYDKQILLGQSIDDSAGEAFDKVARMLDLDYPGGPAIERLAISGNTNAFTLPHPKVNEFDFSFSGLKTAVMRLINSLGRDFNKADLAASFQENVCKELTNKLIKASLKYNCSKIVIAGGVAANQNFRKMIQERMSAETKMHAPPLRYCTDNGAMVAAAGFLCPDEFGLGFDVYSRRK